MVRDRRVLEKHIREVEESLATRMEELGERVDRFRQTVNVRQQIADHPMAALGIAVGLGLWLGRRAGGPPERLSSRTAARGGMLLGEIWRAVAARTVAAILHEWRAQHDEQREEYHALNGGGQEPRLSSVRSGF